MKKTIITLMSLLVMSVFAFAQVTTPAPSPFVKVEQAVGLTTVTLEYSRPGVKGREIFGDLVPYGKVWRTGANQATKITFADKVMLEGKEVEAGTYALYSIPGESEWQIMLYNDLSLGGNVAKYDESQEYIRFAVKPVEGNEKMESMLIFFDHLRNDGAHLVLAWANTIVEMEVKTYTDEAVVASIEKTMAGPQYLDFYRSAVYYYEAEKDNDQALEWINKADEMRPGAYWVLTWKARILARGGNKTEAKATSEDAMKLAEKAGNPDFVKINTDLIAELGK